MHETIKRMPSAWNHRKYMRVWSLSNKVCNIISKFERIYFSKWPCIHFQLTTHKASALFANYIWNNLRSLSNQIMYLKAEHCNCLREDKLVGSGMDPFSAIIETTHTDPLVTVNVHVELFSYRWLPTILKISMQLKQKLSYKRHGQLLAMSKSRKFQN